MSKKSGLILCGIVVVAALLAVFFLFKGVAFNMSVLGDSYVISVSDGKNYKNTLEKLTEWFEESADNKTMSTMFVVAYYLLLGGIIIAVINVIDTLFSKFQRHAEFVLIPLAIFAVAGLLYTIIKIKAEKTIATAGILGGLLGMTASTDGTIILLLNAVLLVVAALIVYTSKKRNESNNNYGEN